MKKYILAAAMVIFASGVCVNAATPEPMDEETYCELHPLEIVCGGNVRTKTPNVPLPLIGEPMTYGEYETAILKGELIPFNPNLAIKGGLYEYCQNNSQELACGGSLKTKNKNAKIRFGCEETEHLLIRDYETQILKGEALPLNKMPKRYQKTFGKCGC